jgi:hypothetical protein
MGVFLQGTGECSIGCYKLIFRVKRKAPQLVDAWWHGWMSGECVELLQSLRSMSTVNHQAQLS